MAMQFDVQNDLPYIAALSCGLDKGANISPGRLIIKPKDKAALDVLNVLYDLELIRSYLMLTPRDKTAIVTNDAGVALLWSKIQNLILLHESTILLS